MKDFIKKNSTKRFVTDGVWTRFSEFPLSAGVAASPFGFGDLLGLNDFNDAIEIIDGFIRWGTYDDPADEQINVFLMWVTDVANPPDSLRALSDKAIWQSSQQWRTIGTVGQVVQTTEGEYITVADGIGPDPEMLGWRLAFIGLSDVGSNLSVSISINYEYTWVQKSYRDDPNDWQGWDFHEVASYV